MSKAIDLIEQFIYERSGGKSKEVAALVKKYKGKQPEKDLDLYTFADKKTRAAFAAEVKKLLKGADVDIDVVTYDEKPAVGLD